MKALPSLGAIPIAERRWAFAVWAPACQQVELVLVSQGDRTVELVPDQRGYFRSVVDDVTPGDRYLYRLDGEHDRPDPASRFQPEGVHGPSALVDPSAFAWTAGDWSGRPLEDFVIYEMHIGTFSDAGTFDGAVPYLDNLVELGITAVEVMPVAQFPGERNWGYDGVSLFAVQASYGGPDAFRRFVDACHARGMAIILDVVYNHLGPEGNYLRDFGPYFTDQYKTPWGEALNFDGPGSDHVRHFFLENARYWVREFHIDGFRLDAVHAIYDVSAIHFLEELASTVHQEAERLGRLGVVIAESDLNDPKVIRSPDLGGWGHDAQWADDFHHALHALVTGERDGYYVDFGTTRELAKALRSGYRFTGEYSVYRDRSHGRVPGITDGRKFVVCSQNHDQVGNRATGDRLTATLEFEQLKLAAGLTVLSPFIPMLFMGEEYAEPGPFQYFVSHGDEELIRAVQEGRRREFQAFNWDVAVPDPQAEATFQRSKLDHDLKKVEPHSVMFAWYRELLRVRRETPALRELELSRQDVRNIPGTSVIVIRRIHEGGDCLLVFNFSTHQEEVVVDSGRGHWSILVNSLLARWEGSGEPAPNIVVNHGIAELLIPGRALFVYQETGSGV